MALDDTITVRVNGEDRRLKRGTSVRDLVRDLGLVPEKVAVERNLEIVPRGRHADVTVEDGDTYEIVHFVGGG